MVRLMELNGVSADMVEAAVRLHRKVGPGLLESVDETMLARELTRKGYRLGRRMGVSFDFVGMWFEKAYRVDLLVESVVIVKVHSVAEVAPIHSKQRLA